MRQHDDTPADKFKNMSSKLTLNGLRGDRTPRRLFRAPQSLQKRYDVVIIGAGGHGLAAAYYLAHEQGVTNVAVFEQGYIGGGGTGRNTAIIRANYMTPESIRFYAESVRLFRDLSAELDFNLFYSERGQYVLLHTDAQLRSARQRAAMSTHFGFPSKVVGPQDVKKKCPGIDLEGGGNYPIVGALYHPSAATARHDAVAWAYAGGASAKGVEIHQNTEVVGFRVQNQRVLAVETKRGSVEAGAVLSAVAGFTPRITTLLGLATPLVIRPLQACVTEPLKPWLDIILGSAQLQLYLSQTARGELVMGSALDGYELHQTRSTLPFVERLAADLLDLFPFLSEVKVVRQWAGLCDLSPDSAPIMGMTPIENFYLDAGWGTYGFKAAPISGKMMAETIATGRVPPMIQPFRLSRFQEYDLLDEKGSSSIAH